MGAAVGAVLRGRACRASGRREGRSEETRERAEAAGLEDAGSVAELRRRDVVLSICPPHAALESRARSAASRASTSTRTRRAGDAREVAEVVLAAGGRFVDGGIVGSPPREAGTTRLYLSGADAEEVAELFAGSIARGARRLRVARVGAQDGVRRVDEGNGRDAARDPRARVPRGRRGGAARRVGPLPAGAARPLRSARPRSAEAKGWRWVGEMEEIAATFEAAGLPGGFHRAAAEVYRER